MSLFAMGNPLSNDCADILRQTRPLWEDVRGKRIFITGGTGFFGCWLLESFIRANDQLDLNASATVLTRNPEAFHRKAPHLAGHRSVTLHRGDVRTFTFPAGTFSHIIHAATDSDADLQQALPLLTFDSIVEGINALF